MSVKLKLLRLQAGLTLEELAQAAELTRSYISKLERGISMPSVGAGLKIAKALGVKVEELVGESAGDDPVAIYRASTKKEVKGVPQLVSGTLPSHKMVAFVLTPNDESARNHPMSLHKGEEILFVLKGRINLRLAERTEKMRAGDSAHFNSSIPHRITSIGKHQASVLLVIAQDE